MKWMPVDKAIFSMIVEKIPSPLVGQKFKIDTLAVDFQKNTPRYQISKTAIQNCSID